MGEARRRAQEGLPPRKTKNPKDGKESFAGIMSWLPITEKKRLQFYEFTTRAGWIGIGVLVVIWVIVRFIGPAAGWWVPADVR